MSRIDLIGVPFDLGGGKSGAREGPRALLLSGLLARLRAHGHSARYVDAEELSEFPDVFTSSRDLRGRVRWLKNVAGVVGLTGARVTASLATSGTPVVLGGDHSIAIGSVSATLRRTRDEGASLGLLWIDAHYDAHTERSSRSHNANGMPLAAILGDGHPALRHREPISPDAVLHVGAGETDCEPDEIRYLIERRITTFSMSHIREFGPEMTYLGIEEFLRRHDRVWVSWDVDAVDARFAPAVDYPSIGGLSKDVILEIARRIASSGKVTGVDVVEYKPSSEEFGEDGRPKTAGLVQDFLLALLA